MRIQTCNCDPSSVNPAEHFFAKGKVHTFIALNLHDYIRKESRPDFERLRGSHTFARAVRGLTPDSHFAEDSDEAETIKRGHEFQVFRGHLKDDWLYPTYRFVKERVPPPGDPALAREWDNYEFGIRLSRAGFLEVKLTRVVQGDGENIVALLKKLMEMGHRDERGIQPKSIQLKLALYCADWFVRSIPRLMPVIEYKNAIHTAIYLEPIGVSPDKLPYRQRYTTLFLREIVCRKCGQRMDAEKLRNEHGRTLAAILEGVLVENERGELTLPDMDEEVVRLEDLASWKDDLCVFAPERALIYFPQKNIYLSGQTGPDAVNYEQYWECINRGIEHTIVIRSALQNIEYYTTRDLDEVPMLTQKVVDGMVTDEDKDDISHMAQAVANTFSLLPLLRDVLVPSSSYRASYAVNKFERLNTVLHMKDIEAHVERNVDELVSFVQFFSSMELQDELNKNEATINRIGIVIALIAVMVAGPSFLADYHEYAVLAHSVPPWTEMPLFILICAVSFGLVMYLRLKKPRKRIPARRFETSDRSPE